MSFRNSQWRVTSTGLETVPPEALYQIHKKQLDSLVDRGPGLIYDFPIHLAEKQWVDLDLFRDAFIAAFNAHGLLLDDELLQKSFKAAYRERRQLGLI